MVSVKIYCIILMKKKTNIRSKKIFSLQINKMKFTEVGQVKLSQNKYLWTIPHFENLYRNSEFKYILSPSFTVSIDNVKSNMTLLIKRHITAGDKKRYINIHMIRKGTSKRRKIHEINATIKFAILDAFDNFVYKFDITKNYPNSSVLVDLAIEEALIFKCKKCLPMKNLKLIWIFESNKVKNPKVRLLKFRKFDEFGRMLDNKKFSDVTLYVKEKKIHSHKSILANASPVFEAMFTHEMYESRSNNVEIEDIEYDAMYEFLRYVYTGKLSDVDGDTFVKYSNILIAADKYFVEGLKALCEWKLTMMLSIENVFDCLVIADSINAIVLKKETLNFIAEKAERIIELPSYNKSLHALRDDLSIKVIHAIVESRKQF